MSVNQSRGDKNEPSHYRRSGRSGNSGSQRNFSGGGGGGKGGGGTTAPPAAALCSGRSFKKVVSNAQGAPARVTGSNPNGAHIQQPLKGSADASKAFPLQFGSISPGVMNGMQARLDSLKATPIQNPAVSKQHLPRKDSGRVVQPGEARPISKEKKDVLSSPSGPGAAHTKKASGPPMPSIPTGVFMQIPFHQSQIHLPFGSPNPPIQSQNKAANTLPLPMHLPVGNQPPQVPPQVFVPGIQHHQGIIHQRAPQLGNMGGMGMGLGPQYQQQPMGNLNFGGGRRTVKITHPETHEELRLDKRSDGYLNYYPNFYNASPLFPPGQRPPLLQSQAFPPAGLPMNYYPNSYNASPLFSLPKSEIMPNTYASSAVEAEVPKKATVHTSGSFKEEQKQPDKKAHSISKVKGKRKKNMKEILKNADAYKLSEEKKETLSAAEIVDNPNSSVNSTSKKDTVLSRGPTKFEPPDDWEDAAELSALILEIGFRLKHHSEDDNDGMTKKYSRDFLLMKFSDHCTDLPEGFEISHDITELFVVTSANVACDPSPSPGRGGSDRSVAGSRLDRRPSNVGLDDKWSKGSRGPMGPGWDPNMGYPTRGNHGVLSTPRSQPTGGILPTPMQSPGPQMQLNNSDSDMWQLFYHEV